MAVVVVVFLAWQASNWRATMAFSIIGWGWESTHILLFPSALVVVRQGWACNPGMQICWGGGSLETEIGTGLVGGITWRHRSCWEVTWNLMPVYQSSNLGQVL